MTRTLSLAALTVAALGMFDTDRALAQNGIVHRDSSTATAYDPFTDTIQVDRLRRTVRDSALDFDRNFKDPGSFRYVDRVVNDQYGRRVREYGYVWTTNGKPHGKLTREHITVTPRVSERDLAKARIQSLLTEIQRQLAVGHTRSAQRMLDEVAALRAQWGFGHGFNPGVARRRRDVVDFTPNVVERDRRDVVFTPNPGVVERDRHEATFGRRPSVVERERAVVNFTPVVQNAPTTIERERDVSTFSRGQVFRGN